MLKRPIGAAGGTAGIGTAAAMYVRIGTTMRPTSTVRGITASTVRATTDCLTLTATARESVCFSVVAITIITVTTGMATGITELSPACHPQRESSSQASPPSLGSVGGLIELQA